MDEIIHLSKWVPYKDLDQITGIDKPGVYVLGHFTEKPSEKRATLRPNIVYIGETTKQTLSRRLYQFSRSAFQRESGHSGGWMYSKLFLNEKPTETIPKILYVSVLSVDREEKEGKAYIKYIERLLIWKFFKKYGNYPQCNST